MSTKYSTDGYRRILRDRDGGRVALTDHALQRWRQRTPDGSSVPIRTAWRRGEWLRHPELIQSDSESEAPADARLYRHGDDWGVVFVVVTDATTDPSPQNTPRVVATIAAVRTFQHKPTRAYLRSHDSHYQPTDDQEDTT